MLRIISMRLLFLLMISFISAYSALAQDKPNTKPEVKPVDGAIVEKRAEPEAKSAITKKKLVKAQKYMIVAANPHASKAGADMLAKGGTAIDAMIAAQLVLNLVEPQSSGIGGGAFLLYWDKADKKLLTYDGREQAPATATASHFLDSKGAPLKFHDAIQKGLAVGVPGTLKLLETTHKAHGKLPWATLFQPAIKLSENGFRISPRLNMLLTKADISRFGTDAKEYFFDKDGKPWPVGHVLKNPAFAKTLKLLAKDGGKAFYEGEIAKNIVTKVSTVSADKNGLSMKDMAGYEVKERKPVCVDYRKHKVCGMGPPSSGALTIGQILKLIEPFNLKAGVQDHQVLHHITEAQKLAYADRARYMADSDFVSVPSGLLDKKYLEKRRKLIKPHNTMGKAKAGEPPMKKQGVFGKDATVEASGTSHISIIDAKGNAVSLTTTIETGFGSKYMVNGFLLNNELTDFSFRPADKKGVTIANRIEGGKRPRSSMAPTIVFDKEDNVELVLGSPGGSRIILYVLKTLVAMIDWGMDQQAAVELANFGSRNGPFELETPGKGMAKVFLKSFGHKVRITPMTSGLHVILRTDDALYSGVDPRREGAAMGK